MAIRVTCQACQASLQIRDEFAGRQGKCPQCGNVLRVPPIPPHTKPGVTTPEIGAGRRSRPPIPPPIPISHAIDAPPPSAVNTPASTDPSINAPVGELPAVQMAADAPVIDVDLSPPVRRPQGAGRTTAMPVPVVAALAIVAILFAASGLYYALKPVASMRPAPQAPEVAMAAPPAALEDFNPAPFNPQGGQTAGTSKPQPGAPLEDVVEYVKHGIVKIETSDGLNNRRGLGSGFVIDASGLVATNYHVLADAAKADVVFNDGTRFGVEGYTAIDHRSDLAIVKLNGVPSDVKSLDLNYGDGPRDASQVYAIGHPQDNEFTTTGGIVGRVLRTTQFPAETRHWLGSTLEDSDDDLWIQHDAKIAPGNSGGPLINSRGEVIGVNSWVNQKLGLGYAIHARHLHELERHQESTVTALKQRRRTMPEPDQPQFAGLASASNRMKELCAALASKNWRPQQPDDWAALDELARTITAVKFVQTHPGIQVPMPADEQQAVIAEADRIVAALRAIPWHDNEQVRPINAHAGKDRAPYGGAFVFGRVKKLFQGDDRETALWIELVGSAEQYFLPLDEPIAGIKEGDRVLVLGIAHPKTVMVGGNAREPNQVRVLLSKVVLPLGK